MSSAGSFFGVMDASRTDETVTDETVPDPTPLPGVCGDYILVRPVKPRAEKIGSIYTPDDLQDDVKYLHNVGRVLAIGPRAYKLKDGSTIDWAPGGVNVGDHIQWERFVGKRLRYKGVDLVLLKDVAVQLKVENPEDLDSLTSIEA